MKKKIVKKPIKQKSSPKSKLWMFVLAAFILGGSFGYVAHYLVINWDGFFVKCPDGNRPDKNGCCAGEVYTDAGDGWMVCCPDGGDNCFPPMK